MTYCDVHHTDEGCSDLEDAAAAHALADAIEQDRKCHVFPGLGIMPDCAAQMVADLRERGFIIVPTTEVSR